MEFVVDNDNYPCRFCGKEYTTSSNRNRHENGCSLAPEIKLYKCKICQYSNSRIDCLKIHEKGHKEGKSTNNYFKTCPLCQIKSTKIESHFTSKHGIELKPKHLEFENLESFETWRENYQKENGVQFSKTVTLRLTSEGLKKMKYVCFRSGTFRSVAKVCINLISLIFNYPVVDPKDEDEQQNKRTLPSKDLSNN